MRAEIYSIARTQVDAEFADPFADRFDIASQSMGQPLDMAGAALFLASPLAAYVVGQTLIVDGGLSL